MRRHKQFYVITTWVILALTSLSFKNNNAKTYAVYIYDDYATIDLNQKEKINILANDYGFSDGVSALTIIQEPSNGSVIINTDNSIYYTPNENYVGTDIFKYEICNTYGECGQGNVNIDIVYKDYTPKAINDSITTYWTKEKSITCVDNDLELFNPPITLNIEIPSQKGDCYTDGESTVFYSPGKGYSGADSIKYSICDEDGDYGYAWIIIDLLHDSSSNEIFVPNGFSPNGDGINDYFVVPDFDNASNVKLTVFSQWGNIVYENSNYKNDWDGISNSGSTNGNKLKVGTYYYRFVAADLNLDLKGYVYINF